MVKKRKLTLSIIVLSFALLVFIATPQNIVQASEKGNETIQQDRMWVSVHRTYNSFPPDNYFYNNGTYKGYIPLETYKYDAAKKVWLADYAGYVYTGSVPIPPKAAESD